jgi:hypothetical protein
LKLRFNWLKFDSELNIVLFSIFTCIWFPGCTWCIWFGETSTKGDICV